jgi:hypothetical protein
VTRKHHLGLDPTVKTWAPVLTSATTVTAPRHAASPAGKPVLVPVWVVVA